MGTEFRDFINATGRVIVLPSAEQPLPLDVRLRVAAQAQWLRREKIPALDAEIGHLFPLVLIHPSCWTRLSADGTPQIWAHARVGPFETSAGTVFAVHVAAASLLAFERELFDGVLAHEFQHYVWFSLRAIDAARAGMDAVDLNVRGYSESITNVQKYRRLDKQSAVPASAWLSPRLCGLVERAEKNSSEELKTMQKGLVNWIDEGLPVAEPIVSWKLTRIIVDDTLAEATK